VTRAAGFKLGTTSIAASVVEGGHPTTLLSKGGARTMPAALCFGGEGELLVGEAAHRQRLSKAEGYVAGLGRVLGSRVDDPGLRQLAKRLDLRVQPHADGGLEVPVAGRLYRPFQLVAAILKAMMASAEQQLVEPLSTAVLAVPSSAGEGHRMAAQKAAELAGLRVIEVVDDVTAACRACLPEGRGLGLAFHFGGTACRASVVELQRGVPRTLASSEERFLGGDDLSQRLLDFFLADVLRHDAADLRRMPGPLARLWSAVEKLKHDLSAQRAASLKLPFLAEGPKGPVHVQRSLDRDTLESVCGDLLERVPRVAERALDEAAVDRRQIEHLVLLGGSCRVPAIQASLARMVDAQPVKAWNPDEVAAFGAALLAEDKSPTRVALQRVRRSAYGLGAELGDRPFEPLILQGTLLPAQHSLRLEMAEGSQPHIRVPLVVGQESEGRRCAEVMRVGADRPPKGDLNLIVQLDALGTLRVQLHGESGLLESTDRALPWMVAESVERSEEQHDYAVHALRTQLERSLVRLEELQRSLVVDKAVQDQVESLLRQGRLALARGVAPKSLKGLVTRTMVQCQTMEDEAHSD
jgi:molecular chaperone DnaK